jgi:hypothetical protein
MSQETSEQEQQLEVVRTRLNEPPPTACTGFVGGDIYTGAFTHVHGPTKFAVRTAGGFPPSIKVTKPDGVPDTKSALVIVYFASACNF